MGANEPGFMQKLTRYLFIAFNVLFTVFGLGLLIAGSYGVAKAKSVQWTELQDLLEYHKDSEVAEELVRSSLVGIAGVIVTIGLITMFISSCGWIGACMQNTCLLFTFSVAMIIITLLQFILGISIVVVVKKFTNPDDQERKDLTTSLIKQAEHDYASKNESDLTIALDAIQENKSCCGLWGPTDWDKDKVEGKAWNKTMIPDSCYATDETEPFQLGCFDAYSDDLKHISAAVGGVAIGFCLIEIIGIVISCYLACNIKKGSPYEQH